MIAHKLLKSHGVRLSGVAIVVSSVFLVTATYRPIAADELQNEDASLVRNQSSGFSNEMSKSVQVMLSGIEADSRRITVRQLALFHSMLIHRCIEPLNSSNPQLPSLSAHYQGFLHLDNGPKEVELLDQSLGGTLQWHIAGDLVVFSIWISVDRLPDTVATCSIEGFTLHVNVAGVNDSHSIDATLPNLGSRSVRSVLKMIERPTAR